MSKRLTLAEMRGILRWSQVRASRKCGVARPIISEIETGLIPRGDIRAKRYRAVLETAIRPEIIRLYKRVAQETRLRSEEFAERPEPA
jgi:hypothetical protein